MNNFLTGRLKHKLKSLNRVISHWVGSHVFEGFIGLHSNSLMKLSIFISWSSYIHYRLQLNWLGPRPWRAVRPRKVPEVPEVERKFTTKWPKGCSRQNQPAKIRLLSRLLPPRDTLISWTDNTRRVDHIKKWPGSNLHDRRLVLLSMRLHSFELPSLKVREHLVMCSWSRVSTLLMKRVFR
jgi:hypothetical protein